MSDPLYTWNLVPRNQRERSSELILHPASIQTNSREKNKNRFAESAIVTCQRKLEGRETGENLSVEGQVSKLINENNSSEETLLINQYDDIVCIASNKEYLATANKDAVVSLYKMEDIKNHQINNSNQLNNSIKPKFTFPSYTSSISCISISSEFHTMVFGTRDGSLLFCSLNNGTITKIVNLKQKRRPTSLLITPSWGFVVVCESEIYDGVLKFNLEVYSINGELIRSSKENQIENEIIAWSTFRNEKGFDFVVFANDKNECYLFEAFYLNNLDKPFFISPSKVAALSFLNDESVVTITTKDGEFILVPFD